MKRIKNLLLAVMLIAVLPVASCKKDDTTKPDTNDNPTINPPPAAAKVCSPSKVMTDGNVSGEYTYNAAHKLTRRNVYDISGQPDGYFTYEYNTAGQLTKKMIFDKAGANNQMVSFSYNGSGTLTKEVFFDKNTMGGWIDVNYTTIENNGGKIVKVTRYISNEGNPVVEMYTNFEYDAKGNVSKEMIYDGDNILMFSKEIIYDDKKNIHKSISPEFIYGLYSGANNITKLTVKDGANEILTESYTSTYTYSAENMPTKESRMYVDGTPSEVTSSYSCK